MSLLMLGFTSALFASEEEFLPWMEVRIVGPQRNDTGKVIFAAKIAGDKYGTVNIEAFGKQHALKKAQRNLLDGYPLSSIAITHEAGFPRIGGHMVHFKLHKLYVNAQQQVVKEQIVVSVSQNQGLAISQPQPAIVRNAAKDGKFHLMQQLSDDDRLALLKPVMSLKEVEKVWAGKKLHGQACGMVKGGKDGPRGMYRNVYLLRLSGKPEMQSMSFAYYQDKHQLFRFSGPGFRYELKNDKFVAAEGPPKIAPVKPITLNLPKASAVRMDKTTILFHCEAILVNRTGKVINVKSDFHSAFDNLSLVVFDAKGKLQQAYVHHQSPFDFRGRFFPLEKGQNKKSLVFPVSGLPNAIGEVKVLLVGELPDGEYRHMLCSDMVSTVVKSNVP